MEAMLDTNVYVHVGRRNDMKLEIFFIPDYKIK
jgi:hypothetical protein